MALSYSNIFIYVEVSLGLLCLPFEVAGQFVGHLGKSISLLDHYLLGIC